MSKPTEDKYAFHAVLPRLAEVDIAYITWKDRQYGSSWKKRGGRGAFMMLARKWDRLEEFMEHQFEHDIFAGVEADPSGADGSVLAEIRDLRRYLANVEAEMVARGVVTLSKPGLTQTFSEPLGASPEPDEGGAGTVAPARGATAGDRSQRVADGGGPVVTLGEIPDLHLEIASAVPVVFDEPQLPSTVRREPICATNFEFQEIRGQSIEHGSLQGKTWGSLYHAVQNADGRWDMIKENQDEYGK